MKKFLLLILLLITFVGGAFLIYWLNEPGTPVFMYHNFSEVAKSGNPEMYVTPKNFEEHLSYFKENGYTSIFAKDLPNVSGYDKPIVITIDDGCEDNYTVAFPILEKYNMKATIFVIAACIDKEGYLNATQIKEMTESGLIDIQSHNLEHLYLTNRPDHKLHNEFKRSKEIIESISNRPVKVISYPGGFYDKKVMKITKEYYDLAFTVNNNKIIHGLFDIPRGGIYRSTEMWSIEQSLKFQEKSILQKMLSKRKKEL